VVWTGYHDSVDYNYNDEKKSKDLIKYNENHQMLSTLQESSLSSYYESQSIPSISPEKSSIEIRLYDASSKASL
jgi:predicted  nucleic acid-binding Zn ribbon protein